MLGLTRLAPIASRQDLCFSKVVSKCTSFVIVSQAFKTTTRSNLPCLGDLSSEQMSARQTHLLPLIVQKSISYLRIWVRPRRRPAAGPSVSCGRAQAGTTRGRSTSAARAGRRARRPLELAAQQHLLPHRAVRRAPDVVRETSARLIAATGHENVVAERDRHQPLARHDQGRM